MWVHPQIATPRLSIVSSDLQRMHFFKALIMKKSVDKSSLQGHSEVDTQVKSKISF